MSTIKDVARLAGVSVGTVSNFLNSRENVREEKALLIKNAMETLDYRPNYMASNLKANKSKIIGILFPNLDEPYSDIYKGLTEYLDMKDFITVLKLTHNNIVLENQFLDQLVHIGVVGIVMVSNDTANIGKYKNIEKKGVSLVFAERKIGQGEFSSVLFENKDLAYDIAVSLLAGNPQENIKVLLGRQEFSNERDCAEGYMAARREGAGDIEIIKEINREAIFDHIYHSIMHFDPIPEHIITSSVEFAKICVEACNILNADITIHALAGEKWHMTDIQKNMVLYGRNAILMGKQAGEKMNELLSHRNLPECNTVYIKSKANYSPPQVCKSPGMGKKIKVLAYRCDASAALKKLAASYHRQGGTEIEFYELGYTKLRKLLEEELGSQSEQYDIYMFDLPWMKSVLSRNVFADLTRQVKADNLLRRFPKSIIKAFYKYDRGVHIFPIIAATQILLYRKDIFTNPDIKAQFMNMHGFELSPPDTWSNFNTIAGFFDRSVNPKSPFRYGTAASALEPIGLINEFLPRQWAFHGQIADRWGHIVMDSEENVKALENLVTTFEHIPKGTAGYFWDEIFEMLLKGEIPMAQGFASHYQPGKYSVEGNTYEKYMEASPLPGRRPMLGGWALGINKFSENIQECYEYIKWNLNDKIAITNMRLRGCVPTSTVFQDDTLKLSRPWLNMVNERAELGRLREEIPDSGKQILNTELIDEAISRGIKEAVLKKEAPSCALKKIKNELNLLITGK